MKIFLLLALAAGSAYSAITVAPSTLGNLFLTTETVSIPVTSSGPITWTVKDYWGATVAAGSGSPIQPGISTPGYYDITIKDGATTLKAPFGIVTEYAPNSASRFGAQTHFAQTHVQTVIPLMAKYGIYHFRDDQYWASVEAVKGVYAFPTKFTDYMSKALAAQIAPLVPLLWSNPNYDYTDGVYTFPNTDAGRLGYANYANAVLDKYPELKAVEVWNEVNAGTFIKGPAASNKDYYYTLAVKKLFQTIKPLHPDVKILAGGTVPVAHGFFRDCFASGILPYCDALSIHPYQSVPDNVDLMIDELQRMTREKNGGVEKPIWVTEFSPSTGNAAEQYEAASFVAQIVALMMTQNVERMYYYLMTDDGSFPYRGLIGSGSQNAAGPFRVQPPAISYATSIRQFDNAAYQSRLASAASTYAFKFARGSEQLTVLWSNWPVTVSVSSASPLVVTSMMGSVSVKTPIDGKVTLRATKDVQYIVGPVTAVAEVDSLLLADSISGHSKTAGKNGWSYGWAALEPTAAYVVSNYSPMSWNIWGTDTYRWIKSGGSYPFAGGSQMHPGSSYWGIRRWTSNYAGNAILEGEISRGSTSDGTGIRIFVDGSEVYNRIVDGETFSYSIPIALQVGSKVDFTVNKNLNSSYDATNFTSRIVKTSAVAKPTAPTGLHLVIPGPSNPTNLHIQ